jgi:hypothetical protein
LLLHVSKEKSCHCLQDVIRWRLRGATKEDVAGGIDHD